MTSPLRAAVADGASGSLFSREWARELARFYGASLPVETLWEEARQRWSGLIAGKDLPWYLEARRAEGAQAAFIGVTCHTDGTWEAAAAGDCCLLHRRENALRTIFPLTRTDDFSKTPALWATHAQPAQNASATRLRRGTGNPATVYT
jgi:hypothetical protein